MALVVALTLLALQGAYTASLPEPSPGRLQDLLTALPDKSHQRSGVHEPLTLIIGTDVKRVFSRKGLPNTPAASRIIRPRDRHLDLSTHFNDSHKLSSPEPVLSLLDNVSLQEPDDIVLRNAVAQLLQEVEDRQAKKHKQHSNAKNNHKTSPIEKDSIQINNIANHEITPNVNVQIIEGSHDDRASSNIENDNSRVKVSLDNTTNVRNDVDEHNDSAHGYNKTGESNKAMSALDDLLKSVKLSRDFSNKNIESDFDDIKEIKGQDHDDLNNTLKADIKEHDNLSAMKHQDLSNKNLKQQNAVSQIQSKERNNESDSINKLHNNDHNRNNNDDEHHGNILLKAEENEDYNKHHQVRHDNHILMEPTAASTQKYENRSYDRNISNHLNKIDNVETKESKKFEDQNHLKQNNSDVDNIRESHTGQAELALYSNSDSVMRFANSLNEYGYDDENISDEEKNGNFNDELDSILKETKKDNYDHMEIEQDKEHNKDEPNDSRVYWVDVKSKNTRLRENDNQVEENVDDSNFRSVPNLLKVRFNDGLDERRAYVDDSYQGKTNDYDDDFDDYKLNESWNNAVYKNDKNHGLMDVNESMYDKYHAKNYHLNKQKPYNVYKKSQSKTHRHHRPHKTKDNYERKYDLESHKIDDHQSCRESKKTFTLSFNFKR